MSQTWYPRGKKMTNELGKPIASNPGFKKRPVQVTKDGAAHTKMVRRQTNDQVMREFLNKRGFVRLRIQPCIHSADSQYCGWHGSAITVESPDIDRAQLFVAKLQQAIVQITKELGITAKQNAVMS